MRAPSVSLVSVVSGSIRGETYSLPLQVELLQQGLQRRRLLYCCRVADLDGDSDPVFEKRFAMVFGTPERTVRTGGEL